MATGSNRNYDRGGTKGDRRGATGGEGVLAVLFRNKVHGQWRVVVAVWRIEKRRLANCVHVWLRGTAGTTYRCIRPAGTQEDMLGCLSS